MSVGRGRITCSGMAFGFGGNMRASTAPALRLVALDEEDLAVVSAFAQDSVLQIGDLLWRPRERRFLAAMNRFAWETTQSGAAGGSYTRRRSVLHFDRVTAVQSIGLDQDNKGAALELLAVAFEPGEAPGGHVRLYFAGGAAIRLDVECIEARLTDLGTEWPARAVPAHNLDEPGGALPGQA